MKKTGEQVNAVFGVVGTAGLVNADSLPTGTLYLNGVANAAVVTVANVSTGLYRATVTLPMLADGDDLSLWIAATVSTVAGGNVVWVGEGVTKRPADVFAALPAAAPTAAAVADAVWDEATSGHVAAGSFGKLLADLVASVAAIPALIAAVAASVWAYATRGLTQSAAQVAAVLAGSDVTVLRGDTLTISFTGLGNITTRTKLWITAKSDRAQPDASALFQIEETAKLGIINGITATTALNGTITVTNATTGAITVTLAAAETAKLPIVDGGHYDVQMLSASGVSTLTEGTLTVTQDVTRATS